MTREKPISFRPTPDALLALSELEKVHGSRSKAINAALEIAPAHWAAQLHPENVRRDLQGIIDGGSKGVLTAKQIAENEEQLAKLEAKSKSRRTKNKIERGLEEAVEYARRTKTNATIAPDLVKALASGEIPFGAKSIQNGGTLRRTIPKPAWKA